MGLFRKKSNSEKKSDDWIYTIKYNSIFETFKYPNPMDFFFGSLILFIGINHGFDLTVGLIFTLAIIDGYFWFNSKGNKIIMDEDTFHCNMWTKVRINYCDIICCKIRDSNTLVINSRLIGNYYLHNLNMFEFERIKSIIDEKTNVLDKLNQNN